MKKKQGITIIERAEITVPAFAKKEKRLETPVELRGQSSSTICCN